MNIRTKGKVGERAWRDWLREQGLSQSASRQQFCGLRGNADVVCPETPEIHYEVKRGERIDVYGAVEQAQRGCGQQISRRALAQERSRNQTAFGGYAERHCNRLK